MQLRVEKALYVERAAEVFVVGQFEGVSEPFGAVRLLDEKMDGAISDLLVSGDITGKEGEATVLYTRGAIPARRVMVVGMGQREDFDCEVLRRVSAAMVKAAAKLGVTEVTTILYGAGPARLDLSAAAQALVEGAVLGDYRFEGAKTQQSEQPKAIVTLTLVEQNEAILEPIRTGAEAGLAISESACMSRDLVNQPANKMTPTMIAEQAISAAQ